jgi:predicted nucleic acid-binding protein
MNGEGQDVVVITDTSVLVNFLCIDRMDLIARHSHRFMITGHVMEEITDHYPEQQARMNAALADETLEVVTVSGDAALDLL